MKVERLDRPFAPHLEFVMVKELDDDEVLGREFRGLLQKYAGVSVDTPVLFSELAKLNVTLETIGRAGGVDPEDVVEICTASPMTELRKKELGVTDKKISAVYELVSNMSYRIVFTVSEKDTTVREHIDRLVQWNAITLKTVAAFADVPVESLKAFMESKPDALSDAEMYKLATAVFLLDITLNYNERQRSVAYTQENQIGKTIKRLRVERDMTQEELSERLDVSNKAISKWESGGGLPDIVYLVPLAEVFGVSTDVLLGR